MSLPPPMRCHGCSSTVPSGLEGLDDGLAEDMRRARLHPDGLALLPEGRRLAADRAWRCDARGGARQGARAHGRALPVAAGPGPVAPDPPRASAEDLARARVRPSGDRPPAGRPLTWEGWEDSAVAPERLGDYLRDLRGLWEKHGYRGDLLRPLRRRLRAHAPELRPRVAGGNRQVPRVPRRGGRPGRLLRRVALGRARRRAGAGRAAAEDVRRGADRRPSASSSASGTRTGG